MAGRPRVIPKDEVQDERYRKAIADIDGENAHSIINQDPNFAYFLAAKDNKHPQGFERMKMLGYEVVGRETHNGEMMPMAVVQDGEGGAVQTAQHVLMRMPKEIYEYRKAKFRELAEMREEAVERELQEKIERTEGAILSGESKKYYSIPK